MTAQMATPRKPSICGRMIFLGGYASTSTHRPEPIVGADKTGSVFNMAARARTSPTASQGSHGRKATNADATQAPFPGSVPLTSRVQGEGARRGISGTLTGDSETPTQHPRRFGLHGPDTSR